MTKFQYFRLTFVAVGAGLTSILFIMNLFNLDVYNMDSIAQAISKSIFVGAFTALILAALNIFLKIIPFNKVQDSGK